MKIIEIIEESTQGLIEGSIKEKWSKKYKKSINCSNPKGFSQRAHCQGRKKNKGVEEDHENQFQESSASKTKTSRDPDGIKNWTNIQYAVKYDKPGVSLSIGGKILDLDKNQTNILYRWIKRKFKTNQERDLYSFLGSSQLVDLVSKITADIDMTGKKLREQDQDQEIYDYKKLDGILIKLHDFVKQKQQEDPQRYGSVGACVLDPDNRCVAGISTQQGDLWVHAEKNAVNGYQRRYGSIPQGSIIITTCSPCSEAMDDRYGSSCTDLINEVGVNKVYAGFMDPTHDEEQRQFNIIETADSDIRDKCRELANEFLDLDSTIKENFADGRVKGKSRPGRVKRSGASCKGSVSELRARAKKYSGERAKMYHWCANMKSGRSKKKIEKNNENK